MRVRETSGIPVGSGMWTNARGRPKVFTCDLYYLECMYVGMANGRDHWCAAKN